MRSVVLAVAGTLVLAGCTAQESAPITYVDPDPVYREPVDLSSDFSYPVGEGYAPYVEEFVPVNQMQPLAEDQAAAEHLEPQDDQPVAQMAVTEFLREAKAAERAGESVRMIQLYDQAAALGSLQARYELARHYMAGKHVPRSPEAAIEHLRAADAHGHAQATRVLAWLFLKGEGMPEDQAAGRLLMEKAALTSTRAQRELGMLLTGAYQPDLKDPALGMAYLSRAYESGDAEAAYQLAVLQEHSAPAAAREAMEFAAQAGHGKAASAIGKQSLSRDPEAAGEMLKRAALKGDTEALMLYASKVSLRKIPVMDPEREAYVWFAVAERLGVAGAAHERKALEGVRKVADRSAPGAIDDQIEWIMEAIKSPGT